MKKELAFPAAMSRGDFDNKTNYTLKKNTGLSKRETLLGRKINRKLQSQKIETQTERHLLAENTSPIFTIIFIFPQSKILINNTLSYILKNLALHLSYLWKTGIRLYLLESVICNNRLKALIIKMERKRKQPNLKSIENFQCNGDAVSNRSALLFRARAILKRIYLQYDLCHPEEMKSGIEMPEESFLLVLPRLESEGLSATTEFLSFSAAGVCLNNVEGGYDHASREKLALLFIICNAELEKPLSSQFLIKDELKGIKKMSDLVDWISNMQNEKDVRRVLEKEHVPRQITPQKLEEPLLGKQQLSAKLGISPRTIDRHPLQFKPIMLGDRKFFKLSECTGYQKKRGL